MPNPPKPIGLRVLQGNPGKRALPDAGSLPRYPGHSGRCPANLDGDARVLWAQLAPILKRTAQLDRGSAVALEYLCHRGGAYYAGGEDAHRNGVEFRHMLNLFGLPPAARMRLAGFAAAGLAPTSPGADPFLRFLGGELEPEDQGDNQGGSR